MKKLVFIITVLFSSLYIQAQDITDVIGKARGLDYAEIEELLESNDLVYILNAQSKKRIALTIISEKVAYVVKFGTDCDLDYTKGKVCTITLNLKNDNYDHILLLKSIMKDKPFLDVKHGVYSTDIYF